MVDGIVDAEETVVDFVELFHLDGLVLGVVLLKVERELLLDFLLFSLQVVANFATTENRKAKTL